MKQSVLLILAFLVFAHVAYGCSITVLPVEDNPKTREILLGKPLYKKEAVKSTFYVFIGEVVGIVKAEKNEIPPNLPDAEGVKVKVTENVYTPQSGKYYEVFPLTMDADCSLRGQTDWQKSFPIGSKVRVVAFDATIYKKQSSPDSVTRL
jgi:hypothetical protein